MHAYTFVGAHDLQICSIRLVSDVFSRDHRGRYARVSYIGPLVVRAAISGTARARTSEATKIVRHASRAKFRQLAVEEGVSVLSANQTSQLSISTAAEGVRRLLDPGWLDPGWAPRTLRPLDSKVLGSQGPSRGLLSRGLVTAHL